MTDLVASCASVAATGDRRRGRVSHWVAVVVAAVAVIVAAALVDGVPSAHANDARAAAKLTKKADRNLKKANQRKARGKAKRAKRYYEKAMAAYEKAYELDPKPALQLSMAEVEAGLGLYAEAMGRYQKVLEEGDDEAKAGAQAGLDQVKQVVATVRLTVAPEGAELTIDGTSYGTAPFAEPIYLTAGEHTVRITAEGYEASEETLSVEAGAVAERSFDLSRPGGAAEPSEPVEPDQPETPSGDGTQGAEPDEPDVPDEPDEPVPQDEDPDDLPTSDIDDEAPPIRTSSSRRGPQLEKPGRGRLILGTSLTLLLAGGATFTGLSALSKEDEFKDLTQPQATRDAAKSDGENLALYTDIMIAGAVIVGAYTVYYYLGPYSAKKKAYEEQERRRKEPGFLLSPYMNRDGGGLAVLGRF